MATYQTEGVILRRQNFGEADRLVTLFSDRYGKIRAVAKGIRRPKAKMAGSLELFARCKLRLAEGKNLDIVVESQVLNFYPAIRKDLKRFHLASYITEMVDKTTQENQGHDLMYDFITEAIWAINDLTDLNQKLLINYFTLSWLGQLGYLPVVKHCVVGHEMLESGSNFWSSSQGGIVCQNHSGQTDKPIPISDNTVKLLRLFQQLRFPKLAKMTIDSAVMQQIDSITNDFFSYHFDVNLRSKKYL